MDCVVWLATFFGCLCISIDMGLAMGLSLGLVFLFVRTAFPKFAPLQRMPGSIAYRDAEIYKLQVWPGSSAKAELNPNLNGPPGLAERFYTHKLLHICMSVV